MNKNKFLKNFNFKKKKVLILGGLGLIGKDIVNTYLQLGAKVRVIDIKRDNKHNHNSSISYKYLDLTKNLSSEIIKKSLEGFGCPNIFINCSYPKTKDWEKNLLRQLAEMLRKMGMKVDEDQLKGLLEQFRDKFDAMGIDEEKLARGEVNFNFDMQDFSKFFASGMSFDKFLSNLGVDVKIGAEPVEIEVPDEQNVNADLIRLPVEDVYLRGWNMSVTVDLALKIDTEEIEVALTNGGSVLQVIENPVDPPLVSIEIPHQCDDVVNWSLNNGILDVTLKLSPQGSALKEQENKDSDDFIPDIPDVSLDFSDDDDEDDGGIPIL